MPNPGSQPQLAWQKFAPFQILGDHAPMGGFRIVMQVAPQTAPFERLVQRRALDKEPLDPELGVFTVRAGLGLIRSGLASFVYATPEEVVLLVHRHVVSAVGASMDVHDRLVSAFAARLALLVGQEVPVSGRVYEFPDLDVVRRAFRAVQESVVGGNTRRASIRLGMQLRGRNQPFDPAVMDEAEQELAFLRAHGVEPDELPRWWSGGVAARARADGSVEVFDDLPRGDGFGSLVDEPS